jgi:hypothetical protein
MMTSLSKCPECQKRDRLIEALQNLARLQSQKLNPERAYWAEMGNMIEQANQAQLELNAKPATPKEPELIDV